jgi:hypothetical protein
LRTPPISIHSLPGLIVSARLFLVELRAHLVEVRDLQVRADAHRAAVGLSSPRISLSSVVLPAPFGPTGDLVAAHDRRREPVDDRAFAVALRHVGQLRDDLAGLLALCDVELHVALRVAALGAFVAHLHEPRDAAHAARAARLDALADPHFFLREQLVELLVLHASTSSCCALRVW